MKVVWRSVVMECGELCVTTSGEHQMLKLSADNWDFQILVSRLLFSLVQSISLLYSLGIC